MKIKMTNLNYQFDEATGEIKSVEVRYQKYEGANQFMTQVSIAESDLTEEQTFNTLLPAEFDVIARAKMVEWLA